MNSRRLLAYIFLFLSICLRQSLGQVFPIDQPYDIDSLQRVLRVAKSDTNKVWTFLCLSETYRNVDIGKSLAAAESARVLAGRLENQPWLALSFWQAGEVEIRRRNFDTAYVRLKNAEILYHLLDDRLGLATTYLSIGKLNSRLGKFQTAIDSLTVARSLYVSLREGDTTTRTKAEAGILSTYHYTWVALYFAGRYSEALLVAFSLTKVAGDFGMVERYPNIYNNIGVTYRMLGKYDSSAIAYLTGLKFAEAQNAWDDQVRLCDNLGDVYSVQGKYSDARVQLLKALHVVTTYRKGDLRLNGALNSSIAALETKLANYPSALDYFVKALEFFEQASLPLELADLKMEVSDFYLVQSEFAESEKYLSQAKELYEQIKNPLGVSNIFYQRGKIASQQSLLDSALHHFKESLTLRKTLGEKQHIARALYEAGNTYSKMAERDMPLTSDSTETLQETVFNPQPNLDSAEVYLKEAGDTSMAISDDNMIVACLMGLGRVAIQRANLPRADSLYRRSLAIADSLKMKREVYESYYALADVSEKLGKYDEAYRYHRLYAGLKDSVFNETSSKQLKEVHEKYQSEKKDHDIELLNRQNEIAALKVKENESVLRQKQLEIGQRESDIKLLNQTKQLQEEQLINSQRVLDQRELASKAQAAELEVARKNQLLADHQLQENRMMMYGSFVIAGLVIALGVVLLNRMWLRKELEKRNAIVEERKRISSEMHDDLGSNLSTIALVSQVMKQHSSDSAITSDIEKISRAAQESLENVSEIVWSLNPRNDDIKNLVAHIRKYAIEYFEHSPIACHVAVEGAIPEAQIGGEQRRNVFLTVKEALHNIIKHSEAKEAKLLFVFNDHRLKLTIHDNGKGIDFEHISSSGNGLSNMMKRMKEAGGEANIENKNGTSVTLSLPLDPGR